MVIRHGRSGQFLGCSTFPKCRGTRSMPTGVFCPKDGGELVERRSKKRGTAFYACSNETCDFVAWNKPVSEKCPECGYLGAEMKFEQDARRFPKVPQVRQRVGRADDGGSDRHRGGGSGLALFVTEDRNPPLTVTGVSEPTPVPSPSWPYWLSPQHTTTADDLTAHVC